MPPPFNFSNLYPSCLFSAPFTIQRLCELMMEPRKNYSNSEKFMRGVEKVRESSRESLSFASKALIIYNQWLDKEPQNSLCMIGHN